MIFKQHKMDVNVVALSCVIVLHWIGIGRIRCMKLDGGCVFVGTEVQCKHRNLTYIPELPSNVTSLVFSDNILPNITNATFNNVSNPGHMFDLYLPYNNIRTINEDSFARFNRLYYLDLSGNHIANIDLKHLLGSLCHRNTTVALNSMGSTILKPETFSLMEQCDLFGLYLREDNFENILQNMTTHFDSVDELHFDHNRIKNFQLSYMKRLHSLSLNYNALTKFPDFCLSSSVSLVPVIQVLYIRNNRIMEISSQNFECLSTLDSLDISGNYITVFPDDMLLHLPIIRSLFIADNNGHLTYVEKYAFRSNTLEFLYFGQDGSASSIFTSINDTFKYLPNLTDLNLGYLSMIGLPKNSLYALFAPLEKLENFICYSCKIREDPSVILDNKDRLMKIDLNNNLIAKISDTLLKSKQYLKVLKLKRNKLAHVSPTTFSVSLLDRLDLVDLSENPFSCDCALEWFIAWLKTTANIPKRYKLERYICASPKNYVGKRLLEVEFSYLECHPLKTWMWVMIVGLPTLLVLLVISIITYRNRWNIKHYIYLMRKRKNYIPIEGVELVYDAFVSYNQSDSGWVVDRLIPILEDVYNCKLCVHERDFHVGAYINDNIVRCIEESKRMILVLSDDFATSGWCMFELKIALSKHIEDEFELIVILLKPIHGRNMNKSIKTILEMTTYLEWTEDVVGEELFWNKLRDGMGVGNNTG